MPSGFPIGYSMVHYSRYHAVRFLLRLNRKCIKVGMTNEISDSLNLNKCVFNFTAKSSQTTSDWNYTAPNKIICCLVNSSLKMFQLRNQIHMQYAA